MKVKEESEKVGLKLNIQKTKIMASSPITSLETVADFIFGGSKITADSECSRKIKRDSYSLEGKLWPIYLDSILKSRDITLPTKVHLVKAVYCHPAYLTYMQSISCKMLGWMKHKLESRLASVQIFKWNRCLTWSLVLSIKDLHSLQVYSNTAFLQPLELGVVKWLAS